MHLKTLVPWWAKIAAKVVLSRARIDYGRWQRWGLFVHGAMDRPAYALRVVRGHLDRAGWRDCRGRVIVELGPGDSLATALIAHALGAARVYLVDAGDFAKGDLEAYRALQRHLEAEGLAPIDVSRCATRADMLAASRAEYFTDGLAGLARVPDGSVDLVFSQAVLEHVRRGEFDQTQREVRRMLKPDGIASHEVDLKDHLGGALNSLRFSRDTWEAGWMVASGFYTNRLRLSEILASMRAAGLEPEVTRVRRWDRLPTPRAKLAPHFQGMNDEELTVREFDCVARVASGNATRG
jgi:SAM-dependent methyltransferase